MLIAFNQILNLTQTNMMQIFSQAKLVILSIILFDDNNKKKNILHVVGP